MVEMQEDLMALSLNEGFWRWLPRNCVLFNAAFFCIALFLCHSPHFGVIFKCLASS